MTSLALKVDNPSQSYRLLKLVRINSENNMHVDRAIDHLTSYIIDIGPLARVISIDL